MKDLAAFDMDGTLTYGDTGFIYLREVVGTFRMYSGFLRLSPMLFRWKVLKQLSRDQAKSRFLLHFFKNIPEAQLQEAAQRMAPQIRLRPDTLERLRWHQEQGHRCIIITASLDLWATTMAEKLGVELICTKAAMHQGYFTGLDGANCRGQEKVLRLEAYLREKPEGKTFAYGNSSGDNELIAWADQGFWVQKQKLDRWE